MKIGKNLAGILFSGLIGLGISGCGDEYKVGKITKESGDVLSIVEDNKQNESNIRGNKDPVYILSVDTDEGNYTLYVSQDYKKPIEALAVALNKDDIIRFRTDYNGTPPKDKIIYVKSSQIEKISLEDEDHKYIQHVSGIKILIE